MSEGEGVRLITLGEVRDRVPYSKVHIYRLMERGEFPQSVEVGPQRVAWVESEIDEWIAERLRRRDFGEETDTMVARRALAKEAAATQHG